MTAGCLPALVQIPVFLSLYGVLRGFHPGATRNLVFDATRVSSFLDADLFGARLGAWISQSAQQLALQGTDHLHLYAVGVPLMLLAAASTFFSSRLALRRQAEHAASVPGGAEAAVGRAAAVMRLLPALAPCGVLVSGLFFPVQIGLLLYFLAANLWTWAQTWWVHRRADRSVPA